MQNKFDIMMLDIERELLDLKTVKKTASPLLSYTFDYTDTTSTTGTHYKITYSDGNQPIFTTFTASRASVIYVFRTPEDDNTQLLDVYDLDSAGSSVFVFGSSRPILGVDKL